MQVLGDEEQRAVRGAALEQLAHFAQHAGLACAGELAAQQLAFGRGREPRQVQQPGRRDCAHPFGDGGIAAAERRKRFEHRQIGLACAILLDALSVGAMHLADVGHEALDERGLSYAGLARDPHNLAPALRGEPPRRAQALEHVGAPDDRPRRRRCRSVVLSRCVHRGDEAIAAPRYRFDVARLFRVVVERCTQFADRRLEDGFADEAMSPDAVEKGVLRDEGSGRARQRAQHGKRLGREGHGLPGAGETCIGFVEFEIVEAEAEWLLHLRIGRCAHAHPRLSSSAFGRPPF